LLLCHGSNGDNNNKKSYSVLNKTGTFEVRKYPSFKYIVAIEEGLDFTNARRRNLWKLRRYFGGSNDRRLKMAENMTATYNRFVYGGNGKIGNLFATSVLLPEEYQNNPPRPFWDDLALMKIPEVIAFARSFDGFPTEEKIIRNQRKLERDLLKSEFNFDPRVFYSAEYKDDPSPPTKLHNEVVFMNPHHDMPF